MIVQTLELISIKQKISNCKCLSELKNILKSIKNQDFSSFELLSIEESVIEKCDYLSNISKLN